MSCLDGLTRDYKRPKPVPIPQMPAKPLVSGIAREVNLWEPNNSTWTLQGADDISPRLLSYPMPVPLDRALGKRLR